MRLGWTQVHDLLRECISKDREASLDVLHKVLLEILRDDPYAAVNLIREIYGEGWLLAHLWDMLWRAGAVTRRRQTQEERDHLILQYARALGACEGLWQLAALYASDLIDQSPPCEEVALALIT